MTKKIGKSIKWLLPAIVLLAIGALFWKSQQPTHTASPQDHVEAKRVVPVRYETYENGRFPFSLPFPKGLLAPGEEADNGDGVRLVSPDKQTIMTASGSNNAAETSLQERYRRDGHAQSESGEPRKIVFKTIKKDWFVISGTEGDKIFYQKTYLVDDQFMTFDIRYPASQRAKWDPIVAHISKQFKVAPGDIQYERWDASQSQ
ncbi:hypothetical protein KIF53_05135 [Chromobacterium subtsugae]|uniref:Uncharacterized protein n=1 Tax=Chromobacterium subtsugae TaxID=251747 RepID=A0ABS7FA91_9NEIS|nr:MULTISPECIES: hypothetical protein [Chromobacterium]KUM04537.1 hypothetical protein Cv017_14035 [Chromobacterium subtsugae]KZE87106.1 hypothetical protein AWB61_12205 [Chromobacterium sp. F49]MBW7565950.1 hypothetical protein [Chromobacterium subtsugae]MBW8287010.1 hypothetical protein [Chromobacterium subtsugae]WSE93087.1 hypothetical protein U6115_07540 [Chromobacterium subtsugae]